MCVWKPITTSSIDVIVDVCSVSVSPHPVSALGIGKLLVTPSTEGRRLTGWVHYSFKCQSQFYIQLIIEWYFKYILFLFKTCVEFLPCDKATKVIVCAFVASVAHQEHAVTFAKFYIGWILKSVCWKIITISYEIKFSDRHRGSACVLSKLWQAITLRFRGAWACNESRL